MNVADIITAKLKELGADGLISTIGEQCDCGKDVLPNCFCGQINSCVPAYRYADSTYHPEPENPCVDCHRPESKKCQVDYGNCEALASYAAWLSRQEVTE